MRRGNSILTIVGNWVRWEPSIVEQAVSDGDEFLAIVGIVGAKESGVRQFPICEGEQKARTEYQ